MSDFDDLDLDRPTTIVYCEEKPKPCYTVCFPDGKYHAVAFDPSSTMMPQGVYEMQCGKDAVGAFIKVSVSFRSPTCAECVLALNLKRRGLVA